MHKQLTVKDHDPDNRVDMEYELTLRIVVQGPPTGVDFGLQRGRGSKFETIQRQRSTLKDLQFEFTVRAQVHRKGLPPLLLGPLVQGPPADRFIYIDIGTYAGQAGTQWSRRMKVPLKGITASLINEVVNQSSLVLEAWVPGTGKDGGPNCGTAKTVEWTLVR